MGGNVSSVLTDAAENSGEAPATGSQQTSSWFAWGDAAQPDGTSARSSTSRKQPGGKAASKGRRRSAPQTAFDAEDMWGDIDTTKVDLGTLAPRILRAQKRIPVQEARPVHRMNKCHECYVRVMVWDPFRDLLISGGGDGWIRLWSTNDYGQEDEINARHSVRSLLVLTKELASGHHNGEVQLWDMEVRGKPRLQLLQAHKEAVYALAMLRSGELVSGAEDMRVWVRNRNRDFELAQTISEEILCACAVPCGAGESQVVAGNMKGNIHVWGAPNGAELEWCVVANCRGHSRSVWALCYVREASCVASGAADHAIRLWDTETWQCRRELRDHSGWVVGLSTGPGWLLSCSIDQTVKAWDISNWKCARAFANDHKYEVYSVCAIAGGRFAAAGAEMSVVVYGGPEDVVDVAAAAPPRPEALPRRRAADGKGGGREAAEEGEEEEEDSPERRARRKQLLANSNLDMSLGGYRDRIHYHIHGQAREQTPSSLGGGSPVDFGIGGEPGGGMHGLAKAGWGQGPGGLSGNVALVAQPVATAAFGSPADREIGGGQLQQRPPQRSQPPAAATAAAHQQPREAQRLQAVVDDDSDLLFETQRAVQRVAVPAAPKYAVGSKACVFSASQNQWLQARVVKNEGGIVTVAYKLLDGGEAQKQLLVDSEHLRPGDASTPPSRGKSPARGGFQGEGGSGPVTEWSAALFGQDRGFDR